MLQWLTAILIGLALASIAILLRGAVRLIWPSLIATGFIFPAILIATLLARWRGGLAALLSGAVLIWWFVLPPIQGTLGANGDIAVLVLYSVTGTVMLGTAEAYRQAARRLARERAQRAEAEAKRQRLLTHELNHRIKNTLATVQAIAAQTFGRENIDGAARRAFDERLAALGRAHDMLTEAAWTGVSIKRLVKAAVAPFEDGTRFRIAGPAVQLPPRQALALSLALHELATNALKYGALSAKGGRIDVDWRIEERIVHFYWSESDGPAVGKPDRHGFGTRLLERGLGPELGGTVTLSFAPAGLRCELTAPLDFARANARSAAAKRGRKDGVGKRAPAPDRSPS